MLKVRHVTGRARISLWTGTRHKSHAEGEKYSERGTPHTGPGHAPQDTQQDQAELWSSCRSSGAYGSHWSHLLCRWSDVQKGP